MHAGLLRQDASIRNAPIRESRRLIRMEKCFSPKFRFFSSGGECPLPNRFAMGYAFPEVATCRGKFRRRTGAFLARGAIWATAIARQAASPLKVASIK